MNIEDWTLAKDSREHRNVTYPDFVRLFTKYRTGSCFTSQHYMGFRAISTSELNSSPNQQRVAINGFQSYELPLKSGVPGGGVMSLNHY